MMMNLTTSNEGFGAKLFSNQGIGGLKGGPTSEFLRFPTSSSGAGGVGGGGVLRQSSAITGAGYNSGSDKLSLPGGGKLNPPTGRPQTGSLLNNSSSNVINNNNNNNNNNNFNITGYSDYNNNVRKNLEGTISNNNNNNNNNSLLAKMEDLSISGDRKSLHTKEIKDLSYESPRRVMRKSYSSSSIEKPTQNPDVDNVQNFDPNIIRNFDNLFDEPTSTSTLAGAPPKSPLARNPRSSFASDQRKRMFVTKKNVNFDNNNNYNNNYNNNNSSSEFPDISNNVNTSDDINSKLQQELATLKQNLVQTNKKYLLEQEEVNRLKVENESLQFYRKNLHAFVDEANSLKFLNAVQEQKIQDLENTISKTRMDHNEKLSEKVRKYKSEASRLKNEKCEYEAKANDNIRQMSDQMSKLQSFAMKRIEILEKELIEERHRCADLKSDLLAAKSNQLRNQLMALSTNNNNSSSTSNDNSSGTSYETAETVKGFSTRDKYNEENSLRDSTESISSNADELSTSSNSSTPEKKTKKKIIHTSDMSDELDVDDLSSSVETLSNNGGFASIDRPNASEAIMSSSGDDDNPEENLQLKLNDELTAMWMPNVGSPVTSPTSPKGKKNSSRKSRRRSLQFSQSQTLKADSPNEMTDNNTFNSDNNGNGSGFDDEFSDFNNSNNRFASNEEEMKDENLISSDIFDSEKECLSQTLTFPDGFQLSILQDNINQEEN